MNSVTNNSFKSSSQDSSNSWGVGQVITGIAIGALSFYASYKLFDYFLSRFDGETSSEKSTSSSRKEPLKSALKVSKNGILRKVTFPENIPENSKRSYFPSSKEKLNRLLALTPKNLYVLLDQAPPNQLSSFLEALSKEDQNQLMANLPKEQSSLLLEKLDPNRKINSLKNFSAEDLGTLLWSFPASRMNSYLSQFSQDDREKLMNRLSKEDRDDTLEKLSPPNFEINKKNKV